MVEDLSRIVMKKKKTSKGRKKIEIKKIEETNSRQVTFSKRRTGLFKKASELCVLTGAQLAILVNSPGGRVFAFGHPNVDLVLDRYLKPTTTDQNYPPPPPLPVKEFNRHYVEVSRELEAEKKRREMIPASGVGWFDRDVEGMGEEELEEFLGSLMALKKKVLIRADELRMLGGPNVFGRQTVGVPANGGGFVFQHGGEIGRF